MRFFKLLFLFTSHIDEILYVHFLVHLGIVFFFFSPFQI